MKTKRLKVVRVIRVPFSMGLYLLCEDGNTYMFAGALEYDTWCAQRTIVLRVVIWKSSDRRYPCMEINFNAKKTGTGWFRQTYTDDKVFTKEQMFEKLV